MTLFAKRRLANRLTNPVFDFPLNLVAHKVAPALAAGNTVVLKPASTRPLSALKVGDPLDPACDVGPMIDRQEVQRIDAWVREAVAQGAVVATGGRAEGRIYRPTVLTQVTESMKVMCLETFAPVVSIVVYDDFEAALALINASDFGLQAGVYTNDIRKAMQAVNTLEVGGVMINYN